MAIHHHRDQPIMALSDVDISPGFVTQLSVTPTLTITTEDARRRFDPAQRMCYFDEEFRFKYLPKELYRSVDMPRRLMRQQKAIGFRETRRNSEDDVFGNITVKIHRAFPPNCIKR